MERLTFNKNGQWALAEERPLQKANFKQLNQMLGGTSPHEGTARWIADNIKTDKLQTWYAKQYAANPEIHTPENMETLKHFDGMHQIPAAKFNDFSLKGHNWESGIAAMKQHENKFHLASGGGTVQPSGTKMIDVGNGLAWYDLGKPSCDKEGAAMGHCGNTATPHEKDSVWSLRRELTQPDGTTVHQPVATFINNRGWIGEMKGPRNQRPDKQYHNAITQLLSDHPGVKGLVGAGYAPHKNFGFDQLSPEQQKQILAKKPGFVDFNSAAFSADQLGKAAPQVPGDVDKYRAVTKDAIRVKSYRDKLNSGEMTWDQIPKEDLASLSNQKDFPPKLLPAAIDGADSEDPWTRMIQHNRLSNHKDIGQHLDRIVEKDPFAAAHHLPDRLTDAHVDHIVENAPRVAVAYLKDRLTDANVDRIVEKDPGAAAASLKDRLTDAHVDRIVEKDPVAAKRHLPDRLTNAR